MWLSCLHVAIIKTLLFRNRYIYYAKENWVTWNSDVSQIPPEWHRWMHYMTDDPPSLVPLVGRFSYGLDVHTAI